MLCISRSTKSLNMSTRLEKVLHSPAPHVCSHKICHWLPRKSQPQDQKVTSVYQSQNHEARSCVNKECNARERKYVPRDKRLQNIIDTKRRNEELSDWLCETIGKFSLFMADMQTREWRKQMIEICIIAKRASSHMCCVYKSENEKRGFHFSLSVLIRTYFSIWLLS